MPRPGRRPGAAESGHPKWSAAFASLLLNAVVAWWWLARPPQAAAPVEPVLVVDFFPAVNRPRAPSDVVVAPLDAPAERNRGSAAHAPVVDSNPPPGPPGPEPAPAPESAALPASPAGMTAVFVRPGEPWPAAPTAPASADPFRSRPPRLPGADARMFRMREPPSPARTVARIGMLFGADGKTGCSDIGDEIAGYTQARDRAALERAIDYERRHCRP